MKNCPIEFYSNCSEAMRSCRNCVAGTGSKALYYKPNEDIGEHPMANWRAERNKRSRIVKNAQATERRIAESIVKGTLRSGAVLGDGDHLLLGTIRQEVKRRGTPRSSWNVTLEEYDKGIRQGIEVFAIEIERPDTHRRETLYCCTEELFTRLLAAAKAEVESND